MMNKREAKITPEIEKYILEKPIYGHFEVKVAKGGTFSFSSFEPQQVPGLLAAKEAGYLHKYSDADPRLKAFDLSHCPPGLQGWVVIKFPKVVFFIISELINILECKGAKSISLEVAREISTYELLR